MEKKTMTSSKSKKSSVTSGPLQSEGQPTGTGAVEVSPDTAGLNTLAPADLTQKSEQMKPRKSGIVLGVLLTITAVLIFLLFQDFPRETKGLLVAGLVLTLVFSGLPVAIALIGPGLLGILIIVGVRPFESALATQLFENAASASLSVLPMFIMMGLLLSRSGITADFYRASKLWMSWMPGGLAVTTNVAGAGLGAASGSSLGVTYAVGRIGMPEMAKAGYDPRLSTGSVVSAGTIGQLIPPSILMVVYAGFAQLPVGPQLLSGVIPGLLLTLAYILIVVVVVLIRPSMAPSTKEEGVKFTERLMSLVRIWPMIALVGVILGGMLSGIFTPTEAGAIGALITFVFCMARLGPRKGLRATWRGMLDTLSSVGQIMFVLLGATILNAVLALSGLAQSFASSVAQSSISPIAFMFVMMAMYLVLGTIMDPIGMMMLTLPFVLPVAIELGISPMVFGVFVVLMGEIALMTPPVGLLIFVLYRLVQTPSIARHGRIKMSHVVWGATMYIPGALAIAILVIFVPEVATWLPSLSAGGQ